MKIPNEKEKFSARLHLALKNVYSVIPKASEFAIKFNLRHASEPVTQQAVYKWLNGQAIPSEDKIITLSKWLNVKPEWLRYGVREDQVPSALDEVLLCLIENLSEGQKAALVNFITSFKQK